MTDSLQTHLDIELFTYYKNMLVGFHLIAFLVNEYFTSEWQKNVRDIAREVVDAMREASYTDDR